MEKNLAFRGWFYFRTEWAVYFAFVVAAVNALTVTFFLQVEHYPILNSIFPTFFHYVVIVGGIGVLLLVLVGYIHFIKSKSFKAEQDVLIETSSYIRRILVNTEVLLPSYLKLLELLLKLSQNEKLFQDDMNQISKLKNELDDHITQRQVK